jgi:hypothetical protein
MKSILLGLIPAFIFLGAALMMYGLIYWLTLRPEKRRSPLTRQLLRGPGHSLMTQAEDMDNDMVIYLLGLIGLPLYFYACYITAVHFGISRPAGLIAFIYGVALIAFVVFLAMKLRRLIKKRRDIRLGLDCEMAVGQELNSLMRDGYSVFHDVPAEGFNIDHIVVGSNGVFAVETKGRSKSSRMKGKEDATVIYDGDSLKFPGSVQNEPLFQARRQAKWVSNWLSKAMAEPVLVFPVLALPGWFIERRKWKDVILLNGKDYRAIATQRTGAVLSDSLVKRISARLEELCRDVEPKAYRKAKKQAA